MKSCPNRNSPEWKALENHPEIGLHAAMQDFMEYHDVIRPLDEVLAKVRGELAAAISDKITEKFDPLSSLSDSIANDLLLKSTTIERIKPNLYEVKVTPESNLIKQDKQRYEVAKRIVDEINQKYSLSDQPIAFVDTSNGQVKISIQIKAVHERLYDNNQRGWGTMYFREESPTEQLFGNTEQLRAAEILSKVAKQVGVEAVQTTESAAKELLKNTKVPYNGEPAFFFAGKVHYVKERLTTQIALHEFSHPIIRSISIDNPQLFGKLFSDLVGTHEGAVQADKVRKLYPELDEQDNLFKEEVIVHALQAATQNKLDKLVEPKGFAKVIKDILIAFRQFLRKMFKTDVSKLGLETTLDNLAEMLAKGEYFKVNTEVISQDDRAAYIRGEKEALEDLSKIGKPELLKLTNSFFETIKRQIHTVETDKNYEGMLDILSNKYKTGELQKMRENLKPYQGQIIEQLGETKDELKKDQEHTEALLNTLLHLETVSEKIREHLFEVAKDVNNPDKLQQAFYYTDLLSSWEELLKQGEEALANQFLPHDSPLSQLLSSIGTSIDKSNKLISDIQEKGSNELFNDLFRTYSDNMDTTFKEQMKVLKDKNAPQKTIDRLQKEYDEARITPERIRQALKGQSKDANPISSFFEGYAYNPDIIVGGLAKYIKDNVNDMLVKQQANFNEFINDIGADLEKIGRTGINAPQKGQELGQREVTGYVDENGEYKEREKWVLLNPLTGYEKVRAESRFKINKARKQFEQTNSEEDKQVLFDLQAAWRKEQNDYWHQKYVPHFYDRFGLLEKDDIGKQAREQRDDYFEQMSALQRRADNANSDEDEAIADQIESLYRDLRQLSSLMDVGGRPKTGDDLQIALRLQEFNEATKEFYETEEVPGAFLKAYEAYSQKVVQEGKEKGSSMYNAAMDRWKLRNTRKVVKQAYRDNITALLEEKAEIMSKVPQQQQVKLAMDEALTRKKELLKVHRDEDGQPVGAEMTDEKLAELKKVDEDILRIQEDLVKLSGLTAAEQREEKAIIDKVFAGKISNADQRRLHELGNKRRLSPLNIFERARLSVIFADLAELSQKEATDSYIDSVNGWLSTLNTDDMYEDSRLISIDKVSAYKMLQDDTLAPLFQESPEFEHWFRTNHIQKDSTDESGDTIKKWERTSAWSVYQPRDEAWYEKTEIKDKTGKVIDEVIGLPSMKYFKRIVKPEYFTKVIVGETQDNRGNWLPRSVEDGAKDEKYVNPAYERMRTERPAYFAALEKLTMYSLQYQEGVPNQHKLYLDFPRFAKHGLERAQSKNPFQRFIEAIKRFWSNTKDSYDVALNYKAAGQLTQLDMFDNRTTNIAVHGLSNLDIEEVSTDIVTTLMQYMGSIERSKKLTEINPAVRAVQAVVNNPRNAPPLEVLAGDRMLRWATKKKDKYIRKDTINNMISRDFEGEKNTGMFASSAFAQNFSNLLFKGASTVYLAGNIPSAIINAAGMKFQGLIMGATGKYFSWADFTKAEVLATNAAFKNSFEIYKKTGSKSHEIQLIEIFDPEQGNFEQNLGKSLSRTPGKDTLNLLERLSDVRKWAQLQATLQIFYASMLHQKVEMNGKFINYLDAWETVDGQIQLKKGVDPSWGITYNEKGEQLVGQKFKDKKNQIHLIASNMNGAMSAFEAPEANRYLAYRHIAFLRRWVTGMLISRFSHTGNLLKGTARGRASYQLGEQHEGTYITALKTITKAMTSGGKSFGYMNQEEKGSLLKVGTEVGMLILITMLLPLMFGFDGDDKDRFKKLKAKSGPLPFFGVDDDPANPFHLQGWLSNHLLFSMLKVKAENSQFLDPRDYYHYTDIKALAFGATLKAWAKMTQDGVYLATGDDKAYYKKDSGVYNFEKKGDFKFWKHLAQALGFSGSTLAPDVAAKNLQQYMTIK